MTLRIALFGMGPLARDCLDRLHKGGHEIVCIYGPPEGGRPDPLCQRAADLGLPIERRRYFRKKTGEAIPRALESYRKYDPQLNVLAVVNVFIPNEILDAPKHGSICFHPSLLPRFRGGSAVNWQILLGEREAGVSVFVPDEGVDTGPIVVQKGGVEISADETTGTLFFKKLLPLGIAAIEEAVAAIAAGTAAPSEQDHARASFQRLVDDGAARIDLERPAEEIYRVIRGCDPQPGAFVLHEGAKLRLFDAKLEPGAQGSGPGTVLSIDAQGLRLALSGGSLRVARVRADAGKEAALAFAERVGLRAGARLASA